MANEFVARRGLLVPSGNVLIGTTSSSGVDKVRVNNDGTTSYSTVNITNANSTANMYVGVGGSSVANGSLQNNAYVWNAAASALVLGTSDTERMRITSAGNVGIGTTAPGVKFVNSSGTNASTPTLGSGIIGSNAILSANGLYGLYTGVSDNGNVWHQVQRNDANTAVYNLLLQPSGGNVGIGTTSPDTFANGGLTLGTSSSGKSLILNSSSNGSNGLIQFKDLNGNDALQIAAGSSDIFFYGYGNRPMLFYTNGSERMRILSGGNVAIGKTTAATILDVNGTITATSFSGAGTGLTGTASSLSIGGTAASETLATVTTRGFITRASSGAFASASQDVPGLEVYGAGSTQPAFMTFHRPGAYAIKLGLDGTELKVGGWSMGAVAYVILHSGNYTSYSPSLTGSGASGTWGINVTGTAGSISGFGNPTTSATGNTIVYRDPNGYLFGNYINMTDDGNPGSGTSISSFITKQNDNYYRSVSPTNAMVSIRGVASGTWGISITGNSATVTNGLYTNNYSSTLDGRYFFDYGFTDPYPATNANTMPANRSAFTYSNNAPLTGCIAYFGAAGYGIQLNGDYGGDSFSMRSRNGDNGTWRPWKRLLTDYNYNLYSPTLTGTGASGTWGISITGTSSNITAYSINQNLSTTSGPTFGDVYNNGWFRNYGATGVYNQSYGSHFRVSTNASHGTWETFGYSKNGYAGLNIIDASGYWNNHMFEGGNGGVYQENGAGWLWYYNRTYGSFTIGGATVSGSYKLYVEGSIYATGVVDWASDVRKKENIITLDSPLEKITKLRGVYFNRIDDPKKKIQTGVIAQEVKEVIPELVNYDDMNDSYSVSYGNFAGLFIEAIKEQQTQIENLKQEIEILKNK